MGRGRPKSRAWGPRGRNAAPRWGGWGGGGAGGDRAGAPLFATPRGARAGAARQAFGFDEGQIEVRVRLDSTGVYLLSYDALALNGYPLHTPIAQVSVHRHEFVE